jgi:tRNA A37 threonylcarbamoyladenosine dehydratase
VSKIRLVDFDYVTLSSLNRHATAVLRDVGTPKVGCIERTLKQISAWVEVDSRVEIWRKEDGGRLLEGADWVIGTSNAPLDLVHLPFQLCMNRCNRQHNHKS